jgi:tetratricopeptide (TPR) repeat protein
MPKARRNPKKARTERDADENERQLRELALFVEEPCGFRLGLVTVDSHETRLAQLERLSERLASRPVFLTRLDLAKNPDETQILQRLQAHLRENPAPEGKTPAIMVVGLEALLDYRERAPGVPSPQPILRNANVQRDAFPRLCPYPVAFWMLPTASTLFALEAPDLWHWRSATFQFNGPADGRRTLENSLVGMPPIEFENLPPVEKAGRVALLRDLLSELENSEDRDTKGNKARRAGLLLDLGLAYGLVSHAEQKRTFMQQAIDLYREVGDRRNEGSALCNLGIAYAEQSQMETAIGCFEQALAIARELGDRRLEGMTLGNVGTAYGALGEMQKAIGYFNQDLTLARELGNRRDEGIALGNLGNAYSSLGEIQKAIGYYEQRLAIARELGDRRGEGIVLGNLGTAYRKLGEPEKAIGYYEQALAIARELGYRRGQGIVLGNLGNAYVALGEPEKAIGYSEQALAIAREVGNRRSEGMSLGNLGIAYMKLGHTKKAIELLSQALAIGQEIKDPQVSRAFTSALNQLNQHP